MTSEARAVSYSAAAERAGNACWALVFCSLRGSVGPSFHRGMPRLLIATRNAHKTAEIRAILGDAWEVTDLTAHPEVPAPDETGTTFEENARIKAEAASRVFAGLVLSDDSGLEVDALCGEPGVHSALYAGRHGDDAANRERLKRELLARSVAQPWTARFRCVMALAEHGQTLATFDGRVEGSVVAGERGEGGFGYDALFIPDGYAETFAELATQVKNTLSHRARALASAVPWLLRRSALSC
jgi:XTP/dITP diphosphohydrolase